jgi:hypothetical protein
VRGCLRSPKPNDAHAELRKLASIGQRTPHKPKRLAIRNIRSGFMPGGAPRGRLDSGSGQHCVRLSSHVLVVVFCGLDWGTRRLFPRGILNYAPNLLNTLVCDQVIRPVMWRHSKMLRVLQQHHSCALPPAMGLWARRRLRFKAVAFADRPRKVWPLLILQFRRNSSAVALAM